MGHVINIDVTTDSDTHIVTVEPLGDERNEIESAAQRAYLNDTAAVRSVLVAADVVEMNPHHPSARDYKRRAESLSVTREVIEHPQNHRFSDEMEAVKVTIEEN